MDFDLAEYDQIEEVAFLMDKNNGLQVPTSAASFLVSLSSGSDHVTSLSDDTNCENDFVFLPSLSVPTNPQQTNELQELFRKATATATRSLSQLQENRQQQQSSSSAKSPVVAQQPTATMAVPRTNTTSNTATGTAQNTVIQQQPEAGAHPLMAVNSKTGSNNPFCQLQEVSPVGVTATFRNATTAMPLNWYRENNESNKHALKPIGLLDVSKNIVNNPNQLSDLMHQIVTRSDTIHIAIFCTYCNERIACPPSDIAAWLNHMYKQHNCKACPICHRLVGLGPLKDIEIMRKHVGTHFDDDWLDKRAAKVNFTFGLQQNWFSSDRCNVRDPRSMGFHRNY